MLLLDAAAVAEALPMIEAVAVAGDALRAFSSGDVVQPLRHMVRAPQGDLMAVMPAYVDGPAARHRGYGLKTIVIKPGNHARGLPAHLGLVLVFDPETGAPRAVMDGAAVTAIRTAAVSGAATEALAPSEVDVLAILGTGVQARTHLEAMLTVRRPRAVHVWGRTPERAVSFADWARDKFGIAVTSLPTVADTVADAQLICTTTAANHPILTSGNVRDGAHVNAVGSSVPQHRELDADLMARAEVFVDSRESALSEAGDIVIPIDHGRFGPEHIRAEVGTVLLNKHTGRGGPESVTVFKSLGLAVEDVLTGFHIYQQAAKAGLGTSVDLFEPLPTR